MPTEKKADQTRSRLQSERAQSSSTQSGLTRSSSEDTFVSKGQRAPPLRRSSSLQPQTCKADGARPIKARSSHNAALRPSLGRQAPRDVRCGLWAPENELEVQRSLEVLGDGPRSVRLPQWVACLRQTRVDVRRVMRACAAARSHEMPANLESQMRVAGGVPTQNLQEERVPVPMVSQPLPRQMIPSQDDSGPSGSGNGTAECSGVHDESARSTPATDPNAGMPPTSRASSHSLRSARASSQQGSGRLTLLSPSRWQGRGREMFKELKPLRPVSPPPATFGGFGFLSPRSRAVRPT
mmetsp:Transcript_12695/g.30221  ORF Transcript_12695/g.30221 Transcript_12695/m.30221 type:complete len:296 (+) Transcript_12695:92-979(+)